MKLSGVTVDRVDMFRTTLKAYDQIQGSRAARLVCDPGMRAAEYSYAATQLRLRGKLFLLPCDSSSTLSYSSSGYAARYRNYLKIAQPGDVIEVNEINGDWAGKQSADKAEAALFIAKEAGRETLVTLYLEQPDALWTWLDSHAAHKLFDPTYVGISYYPRQNINRNIDWNALFDRLGKYFPVSRLIMSELGDELYDAQNKPVPADAETTLAIIGTIDFMDIRHPRFDGGYFWWSFVTEMARGIYLPHYIAALKEA